ncbi:uncharacterized protein [Ptychodera flava]|uniref:uncharacterized protein isoform X3 n=1 Tax=Ptychodera flava TaxID=63121 RepID=UPI003969E740
MTSCRNVLNRRTLKSRSRTLYILLTSILLLQILLLFLVNSNNKQLEQINRKAKVNDDDEIIGRKIGVRTERQSRHSVNQSVELGWPETYSSSHDTHTPYPNRVRVNISEDEINTFPWRPETKLKFIRFLEPLLFSDQLGPESDSHCPIPQVPPPKGLCREVAWDCNFSPTFVQQDRLNRKLFVYCSGEFRVNFVDREESEEPLPNRKFAKDPVWQTYHGQQTLDFESQFADIECKMEKDGRVVSSHHNYRTQFLPNNKTKEQMKVYQDKKTEEPNWEPLSILSVSLDSLSRAHFHRKCGLPKTAKLIRKLYQPLADRDSNEKTETEQSHRAFLFNRINSISGITAMNLYPLYAGEYFSRVDEEERVLKHAIVKPVKEWMWQYANRRGYLTSYGIDTGNGLMGTRTTCKDCTNRPGALPHFEHLWVARENSPVASHGNKEVWSGLCEGDTMLHDYVINYTRDFLSYDYPVKWAAFDLNAQHRAEHESINQVDDSLVRFLRSVMDKHPNLAIVFYDVHKTMKSLLHYPHLNDVGGHVNNRSYNLLTDIIPKSRSCSDAGIPSWSCACNMPQVVPKMNWNQDHYRFVEHALDEINRKHSKEVLLLKDPLNTNTTTTCRDLHLQNISNIIAYRHGENPKGEEMNQYRITFNAYEGPSTWQLMVDSQGIINSIKQMSRYQKYDVCQDPRVSIEFCVCAQFPDGTP